MKQNDYLGTIFGAKYKLTSYEIDIMAAVLAEAYLIGAVIKLDGAPLLWNFEHVDEAAVYDIVGRDRAYWGLLSRIGASNSPGDVYRTLMMYMTREGGPDDLKKICIILLTEWSEGKDLAERSNQISPSSDAPARHEPIHGAEERKMHMGWLATGQYPLEVKGEHEGEFTTQIIDLDQVQENSDVPAVVQIARLLRATWNPETGEVEASRVEAMTMLLARLFMAERQLLEARLKEATKPAEPASLWPKDEGHWIFDPQSAVMAPGLKMSIDHPSRAQVELAALNAAKFAVARASGLGTSRVFNIEGFVNAVALGLIGDGQGGENFDVGEVFGRVEVHIPCTRPHVGDEEPASTSAPEGSTVVAKEAVQPTRKPRARKAAVKPTTK